MKTFLKIVGALVVLGVIVLLALIFVPIQTTGPKEELATNYQPEDGAGEYAMRIADCAACHTAEGGEPFAGGRPIDSPFGTIYSTNITPDRNAGIGNYSLEEFRNALYDGVRQDGAHLYPAMPFANYRKASEEDVRALYDFFMNEVPPVAEPAPKTALTFPFNQRWGIRLWDWVALPSPEFEPRYDDPELNRGAYIVESLGHCGACHSPRNLFFAEKSYDATAESFLTGGEIANWSVPTLRGEGSASQEWSAEQLKAYLASGRNAHSAVSGEMTLVVEDSLQYLTDEDLDAVVAYLRHIGGAETAASEEAPARAGTPQEREGEQPDTTTHARLMEGASEQTTQMLMAADPSMSLGARLYLDNCGACHMVDGKGADGVFPPLDGNSLVTAEKTTGLVHMILKGGELPSTEMRPEPLEMPGFGDRLNDEEVAALATFVRAAWSNEAGPVAPADVTDQRQSEEEAAGSE